MYTFCIPVLTILAGLEEVSTHPKFFSSTLFAYRYLQYLQALKKSADIRGFFLPHYFSEVSEHIPKLQQLVASGQLKVEVDNGKNSDRGPFKGIESVYNGIDVSGYLLVVVVVFGWGFFCCCCCCCCCCFLFFVFFLGGGGCGGEVVFCCLFLFLVGLGFFWGVFFLGMLDFLFDFDSFCFLIFIRVNFDFKTYCHKIVTKDNEEKNKLFLSFTCLSNYI